MLITGMIEKKCSTSWKKICCLSNKHFWKSKSSGKHRKRAGIKHCLLQSSTTICIVRNRLKVLMNKHPQNRALRRPSAATKVSPGGYATQSLAAGPVRQDQLHRKTHQKSFQVLWSKLPGLRLCFLKARAKAESLELLWRGAKKSPWNQSWWNWLILNRKNWSGYLPLQICAERQGMATISIGGTVQNERNIQKWNRLK